MAISIRKRLSKRSTSRSPRKKPLPPSPADTPPPVPDKHDLTSAPAPPPQLVLPQQPEAARTSPAKSLLDRYKNRSPVSRIPSLVTPPKASPSPPGRQAAFTEEFGNLDQANSLGEAISPTAEAPNASHPSLTIDGVHFEMLNSSGGERRSRSAEPPVSRSSSTDGGEDTGAAFTRRATRSQTRRQERIDSYANSVESGNTKGERKKTVEDSKDESAYPRPLAIRKVSGSSDKGEFQRKKADDGRSEQCQIQRKTSEDELAAPEPMVRAHSTMVLRPKSRGTTFAPSNDDPETNNSLDRYEDDGDDDSDSDSSSSSLSLPLPRELTSLPSSSTLVEPLKIGRATVRIFPPFYNSEQPPALQWISALAASSRPHIPWQWCKRWTCCKCMGHTIVEQEVCSKLVCGHERCGAECVVVFGSGSLRGM